MVSKEDYIDVELIISAKDFIKETDKSYCFKLWGKRFIPFPKKFAKNVGQSGSSWVLTMPKWFCVEHKLKSIVHEDFKYLFPTKKELQALKESSAPRPLLDQPEAASQDRFPAEFQDSPKPVKMEEVGKNQNLLF